MAKLTNQQINDIAEKCECGYFEYGDAQGEVRLDFARAIEVACRAERIKETGRVVGEVVRLLA